MDNIIALNFLPILDEFVDFEIDLYRQLFIKQPKVQYVYKKRLRAEINKQDSELLDYLISFKMIEGFEKIKIKFSDAYDIAKLYLSENLLEKNKTLISGVEYIEDDHLLDKIGKRAIKYILKESDMGYEVIEVLPYYLKVKSKLGFLIEYKFVEKKNTFNDKEKKASLIKSLALDADGNSNVNYYQDKLNKYAEFIQVFLKKKQLFVFDFTNNKNITNEKLQILESFQLKNKTYLFKDDKSFSSQFIGLAKHGPLKALDSQPLFIVLFKKEFNSLANEFFNAITGKAYPQQFSGFKSFFCTSELTASDFKGIIINNYDAIELQNIKLQIENIKVNNENRAIIGVFIEHNKNYYDTEKHTSPYYTLKDMFVNVKLPLQVLTIEKISAYQGLKWSISNIALGIFSKLGGHPWKIQPTTDDCIIFGVNKCHKKNLETGEIEKYFAYSVCLNANGLYEKLDILSNENNENNYLNELQSNIERVIKESIEKKVIKRCVLHLPFKIRKNEIIKIKNAITNLSKFNSAIDFQVIKINMEHNFFGFSTNPSKVPFESTTVQLSPKEYLVWFEGLQYGSTSKPKKYGNPVHIEFLTDCNKEDMRTYLQDAINLSGANWRGFNAKLSPISIFYPKLISNYIMEIRSMDKDFENKIQTIKTPWFL